MAEREVAEQPEREQEQDWVDRARAGDAAAFERLYRLHSGRIHALVWRLCGGDPALAEDLVQDAFIRAWNKLDLFEGRAPSAPGCTAWRRTWPSVTVASACGGWRGRRPWTMPWNARRPAKRM